MRAALYLRISKADKGDTAGVDRQEKTCRALAGRLGWTPLEPAYVDNDTSATKGKPRPAYQRLLGDIQNGLIDAILCWQPDRLYRHPRDLEELVPIIEANRIPVQTVNAGHVDLSTSTGRMVARILGAVSLQEVELKKERWLASYEQRRVDLRQQFTGGHRLFGYTKNGEIDLEESRHLRVAIDLVLDGHNLAYACRYLNSVGMTTTRGNRWTPSALRFTLRNPRLAGHVVMRGEIIHRGVAHAIVTDDEHQTLVGMLDARQTGPRPPRVSPLVGLIECGVCDGHKLSTGGRADGKRTYRCMSKSGGCDRITITAEPVEAIVRGYAQTRLEDPRIIDEINTLRGLSGDVARGVLAEIDSLQGRLNEIEAAMEEDDVDVLTLGRAATGVRVKIEHARARLAAVQPDLNPVDTTGPWPSDVEDQRARFALVVSRVVILPAKSRGPFDPDRVQIHPR